MRTSPKIAAVCAALCVAAQAGAYTKERFDYCVKLGGLYSVAAAMRDSEMSPQQVYGTQAVHDFMSKGITAPVAKEAINNVFFKPAFNMPSYALQQAVMSVCLNPKGPEPLK
jgi:hypothetical protein